MSKYMINKLMWDIDRSAASVEAYRRDPAAYVRAWEAAAATPDPPYPDGGTLTEEERTAFVICDYAALYALGAHPFLLWHLVRSVFVPERMTIEELHAAFVAAVTPHGHPDFTT